MSLKRRDNKGRVLRTGEFQRKDGRYEYRYIDVGGERRSVYSWKLVETDSAPSGKKCQESLRKMEQQIQKDIEDGIDSFLAEKISLNQCFDRYSAMRKELSQNTKVSHRTVFNAHVKYSIGERPITLIRYSDIKKLYTTLIWERGLKLGSVAVLDNVLKHTFDGAVKDGLIRSNPVHGVYSEFKKRKCLKPERRHALTKEQQSAFVEYVKKTNRYKRLWSLFVTFLGTGGRLGEILGLRWEDCDFEKNKISINHSLGYYEQENGHYEFHIFLPKTASGIRCVPMLPEVKRALLAERLKQMQEGFNQTIIDGYSGFIFKGQTGNVIVQQGLTRSILRICEAYNRDEKKCALRENREPMLLPRISPHIFRHTFCTRLCEVETNIKLIQEIMGHSNFQVTMNVYNEVTADTRNEKFKELESKIMVC